MRGLRGICPEPWPWQQPCACVNVPTWIVCRWESKRTELVRAAAPAFARHGNKALLMRLVHFAVEGNAWHADHIVPVYQVIAGNLG